RLLLGDSRCATSVSDTFFFVLSIHPKQSACSTASRYSSLPGSGATLTMTQQYFSVFPCSSSQALNSALVRAGIRLSITMPYLPLFACSQRNDRLRNLHRPARIPH